MRTKLVFCTVLAILGLAFNPRPARGGGQADDPAAVPRISQADFKRALAAGTILVVDVRDDASYANGHIPGAVSIPLDQVAKHASELKARKKPIVTYCA